VTRALLFDLDETLMVEEPAAVEAFLATARFAATYHDLDAEQLALTARACARTLWYAAPSHPYCQRVGISSWEGLWCRFEGDEPEMRRLREWSPDYRRQAWTLALAEQAVEDPALGEALGERFGVERRARFEVFGDVLSALGEIRDSADYTLALLTNGASCLQREKFGASGLADQFAVVVASGDLGTAKPDPALFRHVLSQIGGDASRAVMVGDSVPRDVRGALGAGLGAVWLNRGGEARPADLGSEVSEIASLGELQAVLDESLVQLKGPLIGRPH
jgi:putative hydrolase of the HAD superfamily